MAAPTATPGSPSPNAAPPRARRRTELDAFPSGGRRLLCLAIVVLATVVLYYQFYLAGAVAAGVNGTNGILPDYNMTFVFYVNIAVVGYILGAIASFVSGIADKVGRVNIITVGLFVVALLCLLGIPLADSKVGFAIVFGAIGLVEGVILVATPALIRDFSPQLGRASAMGFWTLGPVLGSLVVSIQVSATSDSTPWHNQYIASGVVGVIVAVLSFLFLRELTPELRDQVQVSERDRVLIEARAKGIDVESALKSPFKQMLKPDIVLSALSISLFLIIYYIAVGFFPVFFQTVFGYTPSKANAIGNYVWAFDAGALLVIGYLSDKIRVRKPFMIVGAIGAIVMTAIFATRATHADTSYTTFVVILSLLAVFLGIAYAPWMASFTETVEKRNPALTATGLAVWGLVIRIVIAVVVFIAPHLVDTVSTLVEKGGAVQAGKVEGFTAAENATVKAVAADPSIVPKVTSIATKYKSELATGQALKPATAEALGKNPNDLAAGVEAISELTKISVADVTTIATLNAQYGPQLANAQNISQETVSGLLAAPTNTTLQGQAVAQMVAKGATQAQAVAALQALSTIAAQPNGLTNLLLLSQSGPKVLAAQAKLVALGKVPAADLAYVTKYASLNEPKVQKILTDVQKAAHDSPKQWQKYFWIAVGGEVLFIPMIWLLAGYWSPRRARRAEEEHQEMIERELAALKG